MPSKRQGSSFKGGGGGWRGYGDYMRDKTAKLRDQLAEQYGTSTSLESRSTKQVFEGLTFWQTGRVDGVDVKKLVTLNGGRFEQYGFRNVSHIVATNIATSNQQWKKLLDGGLNSRKYHIVTPQWVLDCVEQERRLPEKEYLPDCLKSSSSVSSLFKRKRTEEVSAEQPRKIHSDFSGGSVVSISEFSCISDTAGLILEFCDILHEQYGDMIPASNICMILVSEDSTVMSRCLLSKSSFLEGCLAVLGSVSKQTINGIRILLFLSDSDKWYIYPRTRREDRVVAILNDIMLCSCESSENHIRVEALKKHFDELMIAGGHSALKAVVLDACYKLSELKRPDRLVSICLALKRMNVEIDRIEIKIKHIFAHFNRGATLAI